MTSGVRRPARAAGGLLLIALLAAPPSRAGLEAIMALHMLVQIPLLAIAGGLLASALPAKWTHAITAWNQRGISGVLLALVASSWWMTPLALDLALASPRAELAKFLTLPLLVGAPVALSWGALGGIGRGFVIANVLPMWAVVGWMYLAAPERVCNYYLVNEQVATGRWLLIVTVALGVAACARAIQPREAHPA